MPDTASAQDTPSDPPSAQVDEDDFLFLRLMHGTYALSEEVRGYRIEGGVCLDLADVIQSLDLPIRLDKKSRRATGWLFSEDRKIVIDRGSGEVQKVNADTAPIDGEIYDSPEGWCVDANALSRWFGVDLKPDLYNAVVTLESDEPLPFLQAIERRSRAARLRPKREAFDLSKFPSKDMEYKIWRTPSVDAVVRSTYARSPDGNSRLRSRYELYATGELAGASVDARIASDTDLVPASLRVRAYRFDPDGELLGPLKATRIAAGDVENEAGQLTGGSVVGRGAYISNSPLGGLARFSTTTLRGTLPAGWDAELYRNGQLVAFQDDRGDGRYEFLEIPLFFGRNALEVVLYGPQGQIRRERSDFPVGRSNIKPGKTFWFASGLQENRNLIDLRKPVIRPGAPEAGAWRWGAGLEHGIDARTTGALGVQSFMLDGRRRNYLEGRLNRSFGIMQLETALAHELGGGLALQANAIGRVGSFNLGANATISRGDFSSEFIPISLDYRAGFSADTSLKLGRLVVPLQFGLDRLVLRDGSTEMTYNASTAMAIRGLDLTARLERRVTNDLTGRIDDPETELQLLANARLFGLRVRAAAAAELSGREKGLQFVRISTRKPLDRESELAGEIEYFPQQDDTRFSLGYARRFDKFAIRTDATATTRGSFGANFALSFSIGPDPVSGGIRFSQAPLARSGQAAVTVFRDIDGDGVRDADEETLEDVYVVAGTAQGRRPTDADGSTIVDGLKPFRPVLIGIDESSLSDPFLAPNGKGIVITPRPGVATRIDLPVTPTGEVEGTLLSTTGTARPGVTLELIDSRGQIIGRTVTEFDGFFLFDRIPYGRYRLRVGAEAARTLQVAERLRDDVVLDRTNDVARMGVVRLQAGNRTIVIADPIADDGG
ncbi:hypothetical protein HME9302_02358 [Alteripontixanthobacter maritimus]|uniref:Carboxypeptidase regulatory-like domain-containing protein n=1 Tax=Alteripontixanthobacter maritimus TaxID=2161824 RepID=A0A369QDZ3_9SPHN|nr:carboxypeptidase-like regulatory domain-containing protein [Alteripontixanthobacter maritimus]RDC61139.1 hypothetical protein HME9302_02358 [Alteripontixanthobacter maritimus]